MQMYDLFEMSNIRKSESGLPVNIYVSSGGSVNRQHGPRIKVMRSRVDRMNPYDTISVMLKHDITADDVIGYDQMPQDVLTKVREYVNLNHDTLLAYWNDEISTSDLISRLRPIT
jgi:hypothetical protein